MERVTVQMDPAEGFDVLKSIPCPSLPYNKPGTTYTLVRLPEDAQLGKTYIHFVSVNTYINIFNEGKLFMFYNGEFDKN